MSSLNSDKTGNKNLSLEGYDPDKQKEGVTGLYFHKENYEREVTLHQHSRGQLVFALKGGITCEADNFMWLVPPQHAVWIPGGTPHTNRVSANASICFLFIDPNIQAMPNFCCTFSISNLVRELILTIISRAEQTTSAHLTGLLLEELPGQRIDHIHLPVSDHPKIQKMISYITNNPGERRTLADWSMLFSTSERSLSRLIFKETGLDFRHWHQQLQLIMALQFLIGGSSVQLAALMLGYNSTTAFITMFKKGLGITPGQFISDLATRRA